MRISPPTSIKFLGDCEHAEFVIMSRYTENAPALVIKDSESRKELLLLADFGRFSAFTLVEPSETESFLSYGTDWILSPYEQNHEPAKSRTKWGTIHQNQDGTYILANSVIGGFPEPYLCRLDAAGKIEGTFFPSEGAAFNYWRIHVHDEVTGNLQKIAAFDTPKETAD